MPPLKIKSRMTGQRVQDIKQSIMALESTLEAHKRLMVHYVEPGKNFSGEEGDDPSYKVRYKTMLKTTIEELEKTRSSFKSQQVEGLRKRLIQELVNIE